MRPLRDGEVVWLLGQGGAALNCCMPLRAAEHTAESPLHIGRARTCTLSLNDQEVSGTHAALWWAEGGVVVADKPGSFNGTFLRLSSDREPSAAYALRPGDTFGLGCVGPGGLGHWLTLLSQDGGDFLQARAAPRHPGTSLPLLRRRPPLLDTRGRPPPIPPQSPPPHCPALLARGAGAKHQGARQPATRRGAAR